MSPDEHAFLAAVIAAPTDDAPREVYADWLLERGDLRGELINLELALSRATDVDEHNRLKRRDFALLEQHGHRWCERVGLGGTGYHETWHVDFVRGFMEIVELQADLLPQVAVRLFGREPVRTLMLRNGMLPRLHEMIHLARLHTLVLRNNWLGDAGVIALAASPHVANLRVLAIDSNRITVVGAEAIAASPYLAGLDTLALRGNDLRDAGACVLTKLSGLRTLHLPSNRITGIGARALVHELPTLVQPDVAGNDIDPPSWQVLRARLGAGVTR